jgi:hypothetical protein
MADDTKRTNNVCTKVTDRALVDIGRLCAIKDISPSEYLNRLIRRDLYGRSMHIDSVAERITSASDGS